MYNLLEYSQIYLKAPGNLWKYYENELVLGNNGRIVAFPADSDNNNFFPLLKIIKMIAAHMLQVTYFESF